jgi:hypothetical protein
VPINKVAGLHFTIPVAHGKQRFRELIVYASKKSQQDPYFGTVKLGKILYYSDFRAYERLGQPITGMVYFRLAHGPAPKALMPVRRELEEEGAIRIARLNIGQYVEDRTIALREPYLSLFTGDELRIVDTVIDELWSQNAMQVADASHDMRWRTLRDGDLLPYEFAFLDDRITEDDISRGDELARKLGWRTAGK